MKLTIALFSMVIGLAACTAPSSEVPEVRQVAPDEVLALVAGEDGPLLVDVRTAEEYQAGHVPGAINIPHDEVATRLNELEPYRARGVVVYCRSGTRAGMAADALQNAGFTNLAHLDGHMAGWSESGREVEN
jgi:phage shock protein E